MIFVTVGTQKFQFDRIFCALDELVAQGKIQDEIFAQIGHSTYEPRHFRWERFLDKEAFEQQIRHCDMLLTHGGVGTIICGLQSGKPVIVLPRLARFKEHVDNHQLQIAESFEKQNYVSVYREGDDLAELVHMAQTHEYAVYRSERRVVIETIQTYLASLAPGANLNDVRRGI